MNLNSVNHMNGIFNYYKENPGCDPNVYEFIQVCDEVSKDLNATSPRYGVYAGNNRTKEEVREMYPEAMNVYDTFSEYSNVFFDKLLNCGIGVDTNHPLYKFCFDNSYQALCYNENTYDGVELNKMLGGVSFYILQQQRDVKNGKLETFKYDNENEMSRIIELNNKVYNPTVSRMVNGISVNVSTPRDQLVSFIAENYNVEYKIKNNSKVK